MSELEPLPGWDSEATWQTFENGRYHIGYSGVEVQKCQQDLDRYHELIEVSQPDIVVETGTRQGGSAMWFHGEQDLQVVSIDIAPSFGPAGMPYNGPGIVWIRGSSIKQSVIDVVLPLLRGKRVMVSLDSDHHSAHVQAEIAIWAQFVTPGCYLVIEDGCFDAWDDPVRMNKGGYSISRHGGPLDAIRKQMPNRSDFWRDESLESRFRVSHSPVGWWRKND